MTSTNRPPFRLLTRCLSGALGRTLAQSDLPANENEWSTVLRLSGTHLVTPLLRWALRQQGLFSGVPSDVAEFLDAIFALNFERNSQYLKQLAHLIRTLNSIGVRPVLLKGSAAYAGKLYPTCGERMTGDIDVLVAWAGLSDIVSKLVEVGYQSKYGGLDLPSPEGIETQSRHYPMLVNPGWPIGVELHVHPVNMSFMKLIPSEAVFRDASPLSWDGGECLLPSPTHFVLIHVIHAMLDDIHYGLEDLSLRRLFEFVQACRIHADHIDWDLVKSQFDGHGHRNALREYVLYADAYFEFPVPPQIDINAWDRLRVKPQLIRRELAHPVIEWPLNIIRELRYRVRNVRKDPGNLRKLLTVDFYTRSWETLSAKVQGNTPRR